MGMRLCLDDFGTGWSSLQHLSTFPVQELKIDQSFVSRLVRGNTDYEVVRSLTALAHTLGLQVTGEGVEHSEQWRLLEEIGCDYAQGYYVGASHGPGRAAPVPRRPRTRDLRGEQAGPPALGCHESH